MSCKYPTIVTLISVLTVTPCRCDLGWIFALDSYGPKWRDARRLFQHEFSPNAIKKYRSVQMEETHKMLRRLLHSPERFSSHVKQ